MSVVTEGRVQRGTSLHFQMLIKTTSDRFQKITTKLCGKHYTKLFSF